ncbi:MAG: hypothetical protein RR203_02375 [Synergistaceae bacterium]
MSAILEPIYKIDLQSQIDKWHEENREEPRLHLGASLIGHPCDRWIWLNFRWAVIEQFPGRLLRLFRRGHNEEFTIVNDLRAMGIKIHNCGNEPQFRVDFGSHVSGSVDGIIESGVPQAEKTRHIAEFKTHSLKSFRDLQIHGVEIAKKQHWYQMQAYMLGTKIERALYVAVCKDNDEMYSERVYFNKEEAKKIVARGQRLALEERIPAPLSTDSTWYQCKFCPAYDFCHQSHCTKEVNCRTCCHVTPTKDSAWTCARDNGAVIPPEIQHLGCERHVLHPDLVPWKWCGGTKDGMCCIYEYNNVRVLNGDIFAGGTTSKAMLGQEPLQRKDVKIPF